MLGKKKGKREMNSKAITRAYILGIRQNLMSEMNMFLTKFPGEEPVN